MSDINTWSTNPDSNNAASPNGFPEGMAPSGVNNSAREVMAQVRSFHDKQNGYDGVTALRSATPVDGDTYWLNYHTTEGDGGGGRFRAYAGEAVGTYTDDDGVTIVPTGGDGSAAWVRDISDWDNAVNVRWWGARGDGGVTINTTKIRNALSYAGANNIFNVFIPADESYYEVDDYLLLPQGVTLRGAGPKSSWIKNTNDGSVNYFSSCAIFVGNYFGWGAASGALHEVSYDVDDASISSRTLAFKTATDSENFSVDDLVAVVDGAKGIVGGVTYDVKAMLCQVRSVDTSGGTITLYESLTDDYASSGGINVKVYRLNTGALSGETVDSNKCFAMIGGGVEDLKIETENRFNPQVIHQSSYRSRFKNLHLIGGTPLAINPAGYNEYDDIYIEYGKAAIELAYWSNNNRFRNIRTRRCRDGQSGHGNFGIQANWDGGQDNEFIDCVVDEWSTVGVVGVSMLIAKRRTIVRGGSFTNNGLYAPAISISEDFGDASTVDGVTVPHAEGPGISCYAADCKITNNRVISVNDLYQAYYIRSTANRTMVANNYVGNENDDPSTTLSRRIWEETPNSKSLIKDNISNKFQAGHYEAAYQEHTGTTSLTEIYSMTIEANSVSVKDAFKVRVAGSIPPTATSGTKDVYVKIGSTIIGKINAGTITGGQYWDIEVDLISYIGNGYECIATECLNGVFSRTHLRATSMFNADDTITVETQLSDATDGIAFTLFTVRPLVLETSS